MLDLESEAMRGPGSISTGGNILSLELFITRKHSSRMRTDHSVTRPSGESVSMRPTVDRQTPVKTLPCLVVGKNGLLSRGLHLIGRLIRVHKVELQCNQWWILQNNSSVHSTRELAPSLGNTLLVIFRL